VVGAVVGTLGALAVTGSWLERRHARVRRKRADLAARMGEAMTEAPVIAALHKPKRYFDRLQRLSENVRSAAVSRATASYAVRAIPDLFLAGALIGIVVQAGAQPGISTGSLTGALIMLGLIAGPLRDLAAAMDQFREYKVARRRLLAFLRFDTAAAHAISHDDPETNSDPLLIPRGAKIVVKGPSGSGKSRLLQNIVGMDGAVDRRIKLHEGEFDTLLARQRTNQIRLASLDTPLVQGKVRDQFPLRATAADLALAGHRAGLGAQFERLSAGLNTIVAEGGANLPSGLRAQLILARALITRPAVLLIDGLDTVVDMHGLAAIDELFKDSELTILISVRDVPRQRQQDRVCTMENGTITIE
jgi:ABC-type bacteriocin/lantibiotic exporter with double-glycine peptidase domain